MSLPIGTLELVSAVFSLGREMEAQRRALLRSQPIYLLYPVYESNRNPYDVAIIEVNREEIYGPAGPRRNVRHEFSDVIAREASGVLRQRPDVPLARLSAFVDTVLDGTQAWQDRQNETGKRRLEAQVITGWRSQAEDRRGRNAIVLSIAQTALVFLNFKTDALGLDTKAERLVAAFADGVNTYITDHWDALTETAFTAGAPKRVLDVLLSTTLNLAADRPDLFSGEEHVKAMIGSVMEPLRQANNELAGESGVARFERFRSAIRGPVMVNMLETLHTHRASIFGDDYPRSKTAAGAVTDALFGAMVGNVTQHGGLQDIFRPGLFQRAFPVVMETVIEQPEAFVRGTGDHVEMGRELLGAWAGVFNSRSNLTADGELAGRLFELSLDVTRRHARQYFAKEARASLNAWVADRQTELASEGRADDPWSVVSLRLVAHVADKMVSSIAAGGLASGDVFKLVDFDLFLELVGLLADQAAETPGMILPDDVNPELVSIAQGVARFIADQHASLLTRQDWRRVSGKAIELAMANPAVLFSLDESRPEGHLAVTLVRQMLATAHGDLSGGGTGRQRKPGRVLFGQTLAGAIEAVLESAVSNARRIADPGVQGAVVMLAVRLNTLSAQRAAAQGAGLSASDWLSAFQWFLAHVVETGQGNVPDERLVAFVESRGASERQPAASPSSGRYAETLPGSATPPAASPLPANGSDHVFHNPVPPEEALG